MLWVVSAHLCVGVCIGRAVVVVASSAQSTGYFSFNESTTFQLLPTLDVPLVHTGADDVATAALVLSSPVGVPVDPATTSFVVQFSAVDVDAVPAVDVAVDVLCGAGTPPPPSTVFPPPLAWGVHPTPPPLCFPASHTTTSQEWFTRHDGGQVVVAFLADLTGDGVPGGQPVTH